MFIKCLVGVLQNSRANRYVDRKNFHIAWEKIIENKKHEKKFSEKISILQFFTDSKKGGFWI